MAAYQAGKYAEAQRKLRPLLAANPNNFEINELTGLVYQAVDQPEKANQYLARAVALNPKMAAARTSFATNLVRLHRNREAEAQLRKVLEMEGSTYEANHNLGEFYIQTGRLDLAIPYLERAQQTNPSVYNNGYDLALAYEQTGDLDRAHRQLEELIRVRDTAEIHSLLGEVEERRRNYLASVAQYEQAARMDPSENNIFFWGTELLIHQTFEPAVAVLKAGVTRFPRSARLASALGIAYYGLSRFDESAKVFFEASDLNPADTLPLIFVGKAYENLSSSAANEAKARLDRFVKTHPNDVAIRFYDAMSLWKQKENNDQGQSARLAEVESMLKRVTLIDPQYADAYFQLGILYTGQHRYGDAIRQYQQSLKITPRNPAIHYRLGQALAQSGEKNQAQEEFAEFERLRRQETAETEKQNAEIQQFVYNMRNPSSAGRPQE